MNPPRDRDRRQFMEPESQSAWDRLSRLAKIGVRVARGGVRLWRAPSCPVCDSRRLELVTVGDHPCLYSCARCRLIYRDPRPSNEELRSFYAGSRRVPGITLASDEAEHYRRHRDHLYNLVDLVPRENRLGAHRRALDVGCGNGLNLEVLTHRGWMAEGIDPNPEQVAVLVERGHTAAVADLQQATADRWRKRRYDLVTLLHVIEHLSDPLALIQALGPLLTATGALVIETPLCCDLGNQDHLFFLSGSSLNTLLERAGFIWRSHHLYVAHGYAHDNLLVLATLKEA